MSRYLIETPHTAKDCMKLIDWIEAQGYLHNFEWGCMSGVHCGWAIVESDSEKQVQMMVPPILRDRARVIRLNKFTEEDTRAFHEVE